MNDSSSAEQQMELGYVQLSFLPDAVVPPPEKKKQRPVAAAKKPEAEMAEVEKKKQKPSTPASATKTEKKKPQRPVAAKKPASEPDFEEKRQKLQASASAAQTDTLLLRVATLLNHYPETRDCDMTLLLRYWKEYESHVLKGDSLSTGDLYQLTRLTSIVRARARVQNHYRLFAPIGSIRPRQGALSWAEREKAIQDKQIHPALGVYLDKSGGTGENLILSSFWFLPGMASMFHIRNEVRSLRERHSFDRDFAFEEIDENNLPVYQDLVRVLLANAPSASFKFAVLRNKEGTVTQDATAKLSHQLLVKGIQSEESAGRTLLPRCLQVWKNAEEDVADKQLLGAVEEKLKEASGTTFDGKLRVDQLISVASQNNLFLQVADLVAGSLNCVLSRAPDTRTPKDEFSDFLLTSLRGSIDLPDNATVDELTYHESLG